jgi:hypothetical protein
MKAVFSLCALAALAAASRAQSVSVTVDAAAPATLFADVNGQLVTQALPAGPLAAEGMARAEQLLPPTGIAFAQVGWGTFANSFFAQGGVEWIAGVTAAPPSFADTTPIDMLITFHASAPVAVNLELTRQSFSSVGSTTFLNRIDIGNDGTFEIDETSPTGLVFGPFVLGAPLQVLVRCRPPRSPRARCS